MQEERMDLDLGKRKKKKISRYMLDEQWARVSFGRWTDHEHQKYVCFIRQHYRFMKSSQLRYHNRIFNDMAAFIGTRNSDQCKSHHQKMLQKYQYKIENIIFRPEKH